MIASAREACLGVLLLLSIAGCAGASAAAPRSAAVLAEPVAAQRALERALRGRGVAVAPAPSPADAAAGSIDAARRELARAVEAQQSFREAEAIEILSHAESLASARGVGPAERALLAEIGFLRAWLHLSAGQPADAEREAARAAVFADPGAPDPARYPPEVVALFARVASAPRAPGTLRIAVRGDADAHVRLDGRDLGGAPLEAGGLLPGSHTVAIEAPGRQPIADRVEVPPGGSVARTYTLAPLAASDLARAALSTRGPAGLEAGQRLAAALSVEGLLVARGRPRGDGIVLEAVWIPESGSERSVDGRGGRPAAAADDVARRLWAGPPRSGSPGPWIWIAGGVLVAAAAAGVAAAIALGGEETAEGGALRCCAVR